MDIEEIKRYEQMSDWDEHDEEILNVMRASASGDWCKSTDVVKLEAKITQLESERDKYKDDAVEMAKEVIDYYSEFDEDGEVTRYYCPYCDVTKGDDHIDDDCYNKKAEQLLSDNKHIDSKEIT